MDEFKNGTEDIWWVLEGLDYPILWWELIRTNSFGVAGVVRLTLTDYMIDTFNFIRILNTIETITIISVPRRLFMIFLLITIDYIVSV